MHKPRHQRQIIVLRDVNNEHSGLLLTLPFQAHRQGNNDKLS